MSKFSPPNSGNRILPHWKDTLPRIEQWYTIREHTNHAQSYQQGAEVQPCDVRIVLDLSENILEPSRTGLLVMVVTVNVRSRQRKTGGGRHSGGSGPTDLLIDNPCRTSNARNASTQTELTDASVMNESMFKWILQA